MITIDARWINASGMGTYLRSVIPGIISGFPDEKFTLLGRQSDLSRLGIESDDRLQIIRAESRMYSLAEQIEIPWKIPRSTRLFFAPHYNVPLLYRGRMLVTVYDLFHIAMPGLVGGAHKRAYARLMFWAVRRQASSIITISHFTKVELLRHTSGTKKPIYPIHLGVDESWFNVRSECPPHGKPYMLYVGNVKPHKNLGALVKAMEYIGDKVPHDLVIVGKKEGFITGDHSVVSEALKLDGRVYFTGRITDDKLKQYMAHAALFVFPSLYEGFGLPPLEAMAVGCPVVVSNTASLPEVCGDAAVYCNPYEPRDIANRILNVLGSEAVRLDLTRRGLEKARQFTWSACIQRTCEVIERLLDDG